MALSCIALTENVNGENNKHLPTQFPARLRKPRSCKPVSRVRYSTFDLRYAGYAPANALRLPYSSVCSRRESSDPRKGAQTKKVPTLLQELWQAKVLLHLRRGQREGGGHSATRAKEMQSTDRLGAGLSANTRLTSETQDLWNEVAHEAEFAERHNTRFKSYQQAANYHHAQLAALRDMMPTAIPSERVGPGARRNRPHHRNTIHHQSQPRWWQRL